MSEEEDLFTGMAKDNMLTFKSKINQRLYDSQAKSHRGLPAYQGVQFNNSRKQQLRKAREDAKRNDASQDSETSHRGPQIDVCSEDSEELKDEVAPLQMGNQMSN